MKLINSREDPEEREGLVFEKVNDFRYLSSTLNTKITGQKN